MRKALLLLILVGIALAAAGWWLLSGNDGGDDDAIVLYGNVDIRQIELAFKSTERITRMHAQEGQRVQRGEVLATLDPVRAEQSLRRAEAQMAAQQQQLAEFEAGTRPEEIERLQAELAAARAEAHNALLSARRLEDLGERKLASPEQVDNAHAALDAAQGRAKAAAAALKLAQAGPRTEQVARARALVQVAAAEVELARQGLADTRLLAPADGVVRDRMAEPGDMAAPGKAVYSIALTDPIWVRTYVPETALGRLRPGQAAEVYTDSFPAKPYRAWIGYISPTAEFTPKAVETEQLRSDLVYQMRVHVCNPNDELRLGMPATVRVPQPAAESPTGAENPCAPPAR